MTPGKKKKRRKTNIVIPPSNNFSSLFIPCLTPNHQLRLQCHNIHKNIHKNKHNRKPSQRQLPPSNQDIRRIYLLNFAMTRKRTGLEVSRRFLERLYLTRADLLPNPHTDIRWLALYHSQNITRSESCCASK